MQKIGTVPGIRNIRALPRNTEKMRSINFNCYTLLDSLAFLNGSLGKSLLSLPVLPQLLFLSRSLFADTLVKDLCTNTEQKFELLDQMGFYKKEEDEKRKMLLRKQSFPYEYATSVEKLQATLKIPDREHFHSMLTDSDITQDDYEHAVSVFDTYKMKSLLDFYIFYCEIDTILLCEVLWEFREESFEAFGNLSLSLFNFLNLCIHSPLSLHRFRLHTFPKYAPVFNGCLFVYYKSKSTASY